MTTAELRASHRRQNRNGIHALEAQRLIDLAAFRIAPATAAGLIAYSHMSEVGTGLIVFVCMLVATHAIEPRDLPLQLMPGSRILVGVLAPVAGALAAWLVLVAAGHGYALSQFEAVLLGTWLVLALGAWTRLRVTSKLTARVAVLGGREFAADFAAELIAARVATYEVVGWVGSTGRRSTGACAGSARSTTSARR